MKLAISRSNLFHLCLAFLILGPLVTLIFFGVNSAHVDNESWEILKTLIPTHLAHSVSLCLMTAFYSLTIGVTLAFIQVFSNIPFKKILHYLYLLPLCIPIYVTSFVYVGALEYSADLPTFLRQTYSIDLNSLFHLKSLPALSLVFSLCLFPYVYITSKNAFESFDKRLFWSSKCLGTSPWKTFIKLILPYSKLWILSGTILVMMECLADFGGVSIFNYDTLTTSIYTAWSSLFSLKLAAKISIILILLALSLSYFENSLTKKFYAISNNHQKPDPFIKSSALNIIFLLFSVLIICLSSLFPLFQLIIWFIKTSPLELSSQYTKLILNSFLIAIAASFLIVVPTVFSIFSQRLNKSKFVQQIKPWLLIGYAIPGNILAISTFIFFSTTNIMSSRSFVFMIILLLIGYVSRYLAIGYRNISNSYKNMRVQLDLASRSLGVSGFGLFKRVHFPLLKKSLVITFIILFIEVLKEMPMTLMLRPISFNTLAVKVYELTSEGEWERAAIPSLFIVSLAILASTLLTRFSKGNHAPS